MPAIDETHEDIIILVERDFGPINEVGNQIALRNRQIWIEGGKKGRTPPKNWKRATLTERQDIERRLILSWMQYRARIIPQRQRILKLSTRAQKDGVRYPIIYKIIDEVCQAGDARPYLSRGLFGGKGWNHSLDPLFSAFQICHFHLSDIFVSPKMAKSTKNLLFAIVKSDSFHVLGVFDHNFGAQDLLKTWTDSFPEDFLQLKGILPGNKKWTFDEMRRLVKSGLTVSINMGDEVWMPKSIGVATSGIGNRTVNYYIQMRNKTKIIANPRGPTAIFPKRIGVKHRISGEFDVYDKDLERVDFKLERIRCFRCIGRIHPV